MRKMNFQNTRIILFIIILLGIGLRVYKLDKYGLWHDEQWCVSTSVGLKYSMFDKVNFFNQWASPWRDNWWKNDTTWKDRNVFTSNDFWKHNRPSHVIEATIYSSNNPAYNISLHYWIKIFDISDFSVRSYSALWGILVVFIAFPFARFLFNSNKIALFATFLIAVHPILIVESQSAKAHSMAIFLSFLSTLLFLKIIKGEKQKFILGGYIIACALALLTHMLVIYVLLGHLLVMLFFIRDKTTWLRLGIAGLIISLLYSAWLFSGGIESIRFLEAFTGFIKSNVNNPRWSGHLFFLSFTPANYLRAIEKMVLSFFGNTLYNTGLRFRHLILLFFVPVVMMIIGYFKIKHKGYNKEMLIVITMLLAQFLFATAMAAKDNQMMQFFPVNSVHAIPYVMMLFAAISQKVLEEKGMVKTLFSVFIVFQIVIMLYSTFQIYFNEKDQGYDLIRNPNRYRSAAASIMSSYNEKDTVIYGEWRIAQCTNLYLKDAPYIVQKVDTLNTVQTTDSTEGTSGKVWLSKYQGGSRKELFDFGNWR